MQIDLDPDSVDSEAEEARLRTLLKRTRSFLDTRFVDARTEQERLQQRPMSTGNCWAASRFLATILNRSVIHGLR